MKNSGAAGKRVVIAGGGFAGLMTARRLLNSGLEVTVIDPSPIHTYTPWLFEVATCALVQQRVRRARSGSADIEHAGVASMGKVRFKRAGVVGLDKAAQHVLCDDGSTVPYDALVIALGAVAYDFGVPGVREHAFMLKTSHDAGKISAAVSGLLEAAKTEARSVAIIGGGPTGLEVAGEIAHAANVLAKRGLISRNNVKITVVDGGSRYFQNGSPAVSERLAARFAKLGVSFVGNAQVAHVMHHQIAYEIKGQKLTPTLKADLKIWAGGVMVNPVVKTLPLKLDERGRIQVEPTFIAKGEANIFAVGDNMALPNPVSGQPEPMTAQAAVVESTVVADNVRRLVSGRALRAFKSPGRWHTLLAIGGRWGVGEMYGVTFSGFGAYVLRLLADLRYFVGLLTLWPGLKFWLRGRF